MGKNTPPPTRLMRRGPIGNICRRYSQPVADFAKDHSEFYARLNPQEEVTVWKYEPNVPPTIENCFGDPNLFREAQKLFNEHKAFEKHDL